MRKTPKNLAATEPRRSSYSKPAPCYLCALVDITAGFTTVLLDLPHYAASAMSLQISSFDPSPSDNSELEIQSGCQQKMSLLQHELQNVKMCAERLDDEVCSVPQD